MARKKIGGFSDYIIPRAVVGVGFYFLNKLGIFGGSSSSSPGLLSPGGALSPQSSSTATQQATLATLDSLQTFYNAQPAATNPFQATLYNNNPAAATITSAQATSLWSDLQTAYNGSGFLSLFKAQPDLSPVLAQFQGIVQTGEDISLVATLCQSATGSDLGTWLFNSFANDQTGSSGITNMQMLNNFMYWAFSLPID
jgi:hypothetical protein